MALRDGLVELSASKVQEEAEAWREWGAHDVSSSLKYETMHKVTL